MNFDCDKNEWIERQKTLKSDFIFIKVSISLTRIYKIKLHIVPVFKIRTISKSKIMSTSAVRALALEYKSLQEEPVEGFRVKLLNDDNLFEWEVAIFGPPDTLYQGGYFKVSILQIIFIMFGGKKTVYLLKFRILRDRNFKEEWKEKINPTHIIIWIVCAGSLFDNFFHHHHHHILSYWNRESAFARVFFHLLLLSIQNKGGNHMTLSVLIMIWVDFSNRLWLASSQWRCNIWKSIFFLRCFIYSSIFAVVRS